MMNVKNLLIILLALLALAAGVWVRQIAHTANQQVTQVVNFSFPDSSGQAQSVDQWRGKLLIINFWASWCAPCLQEIPEFMQIQQEFREKGLQFIGVAIEEAETLLPYLQEQQINYPVLIAGDAGIIQAQQLGNVSNAVPFTLIVNPAGEVVHRHPGALSREKLLEIIAPLLPATGQIP